MGCCSCGNSQSVAPCAPLGCTLVGFFLVVREVPWCCVTSNPGTPPLWVAQPKLPARPCYRLTLSCKPMHQPALNPSTPPATAQCPPHTPTGKGDGRLTHIHRRPALLPRHAAARGRRRSACSGRRLVGDDLEGEGGGASGVVHNHLAVVRQVACRVFSEGLWLARGGGRRVVLRPLDGPLSPATTLLFACHPPINAIAHTWGACKTQSLL